MVIGTLAVDEWAITFGTAMRGLGNCGPAQSSPRCTKCNSLAVNGQCTNFILFDLAHRIASALSRIYRLMSLGQCACPL